MLAKTAGVKHLVVLINRMDDPTVGWSEERLALTYPFLMQGPSLSCQRCPIATWNC